MTAKIRELQTDIDATQHSKTRHCDAVSHSATPTSDCASAKKTVKKKKRKGNLEGRVAGAEPRRGQQMVGEELQVSEECKERLI